MEAKDLHATPESAKSLMDKIAADPEFINREASTPAEVVTKAGPSPSPTAASTTVGNGALMGAGEKAPIFNLLAPKALEAEGPPAAAGASGTPAPAQHGRARLVVTMMVLLVLAGGGAAAYLLYWRPANTPVAQVAPTSTPRLSATPSPAPTPSPSPTATPTPAPTPPPQTVTAPPVAPTPEHPQTVTVTAKSGLWLRSTPDSSNRSNIIGWMPNGATVSVDAAGSFWWHGSYKGRSGYFAVNYTQQ